MIKRLWYINAAIVLAALIILISGLSALHSGNYNGNTLRKTHKNTHKKGVINDNSDKNRGDSAFVAVIREYSDRWAVPVGSVKVNILPENAAKQGGKWRLLGGKWHTSGQEIKRVLTGKKTIEFSPLDGWITPARQSIDVKRKQTTTVEAKYIRRTYGSVVVDIEPNEVLLAQPGWKLANPDKNGGNTRVNWYKSGQKVQKVPVGTQTIVFKEVADWYTPKQISIKIEQNSTKRVKARYKAKEYGKLVVKIGPNEVLACNPQWRIGNGSWHKSGAEAGKVVVGKQKVTFQVVPGWLVPDETSVEITRNKLSEITAMYKKIPTGQVTASISPAAAVKAGAMWRIDGDKNHSGKWYKPGQVVSGVKVGDVEIEANKVKGWVTPAKKKIKVQENQVSKVQLLYDVPVPPAPKLTLTGTVAFDNDNSGIIWAILPGSSREQVFFAGDMVGAYRLDKVMDGEAVFVRSGHKFVVKILEKSKSSVSPSPPKRPEVRKPLGPPYNKAHPSYRRTPSRGIPPRTMPPRGMPPRGMPPRR